MNILVTGANDFIGNNLIAKLKESNHTIWEYDGDSPKKKLNYYLKECDFIFHLASINHTPNAESFWIGNSQFTELIIKKLKRYNNICPIVVPSSIDSQLDRPLGKSKQVIEELVFDYAKETGTNAYVYRLPNIFGKWCKPNYNSVISTLCYHISRGLDINIHDKEQEINLTYIDNVIDEFLRAFDNNPTYGENKYCIIPEVFSTKLGYIVDKLYSFKRNQDILAIPSFDNNLDKYLYSTYLTYLPENDFAYPLNCKYDDRGSFSEFIKSTQFGQISVCKTKPGAVRGNHWHNTKIEKFLVVQGTGLIHFRKVLENSIIDYPVAGEKSEVINVPIGYTHSIENVGDDDLIMVIWCNEVFNPNIPDTYFLEVKENVKV